jgi:hypothetical protein
MERGFAGTDPAREAAMLQGPKEPGRQELERLMGIVREHAKATLAKPVTQRDSHLGFLRNNWKRYAIGINRRNFEAERFAAVMDRATRDLITLIEESGGVEHLEDRQRLKFTRDSVEGAMDSVIAYEAAIEPPEEAAPAEQAAPSAEEPAVVATEAEAPAAPPPEPQIDTVQAQAAEDEDRQSARYGFGASRNKVAPDAVEVRIDSELQRRVQAALRARQLAMPKSDEDR